MSRFNFRVWIKGSEIMVTDVDDPAMPFLQSNGLLYIDYDLTDVTEDCVLMQSTGLKDSGGVEIFEGDILRKPATSQYEETSFLSWEVYHHDNDSAPYGVGLMVNRCKPHGNLAGGLSGWRLLPENMKRLIVIGNIYENKELLK